MQKRRQVAALQIVLICGFLIAACSTKPQAISLPPGEWIDLSHDFSAETVYWPTAEPFKLETVSEGMTPNGYYYSAYKFSGAEHGGTHIDAPIHFAQGHNSVDQIPVSQLIAPAIKIDLLSKVAGNRDYLISVADLTSWESRNGRIPDGVIVLLQTGWASNWPDKIKYLGTDKLGAEGVAALHFPGLSPEAARWLTEQRKINAIGIDTASIDYGQSQLFETHRILMEKNIPALENLATLDGIPASGALLVAMPMKIKGGSGGPLRVVALVPHS
jgi:kynurenine formamidase